MDTDDLWYWVSNGSPLMQALALTLLDRELDGAISELAKRILQNEK
jgi:hypothetical protein